MPSRLLLIPLVSCSLVAAAPSFAQGFYGTASAGLRVDFTTNLPVSLDAIGTSVNGLNERTLSGIGQEYGVRFGYRNVKGWFAETGVGYYELNHTNGFRGPTVPGGELEHLHFRYCYVQVPLTVGRFFPVAPKWSLAPMCGVQLLLSTGGQSGNSIRTGTLEAKRDRDRTATYTYRENLPPATGWHLNAGMRGEYAFNKKAAAFADFRILLGMRTMMSTGMQVADQHNAAVSKGDGLGLSMGLRYAPFR